MTHTALVRRRIAFLRQASGVTIVVRLGDPHPQQPEQKAPLYLMTLAGTPCKRNGARDPHLHSVSNIDVRDRNAYRIPIQNLRSQVCPLALRRAELENDIAERKKFGLPWCQEWPMASNSISSVGQQVLEDGEPAKVKELPSTLHMAAGVGFAL